MLNEAPYRFRVDRIAIAAQAPQASAAIFNKFSFIEFIAAPHMLAI
ncbi:hypothetical protein [Ralstonia pseudosolanacearum]